MSIIRDITLKAEKYLDSEEILLFTGARQSGKTTILRQLQAVVEGRKAVAFYLNLEDPEFLELLNQNPKNVLNLFPFDVKKKNFLFVDEVQYLKNPTNFLKFVFDEYREFVKLIVSGSSAFYLDRKFKDSLAGRKRIFPVKTLSFKEFLRFKSEQALAGKDLRELSLSEQGHAAALFREYVIWGGYPKVVLASVEEKPDLLRELAYSYLKKDMFEANVRREEGFMKLVKMIASQVGSLANATELAGTIGVSKTAIDSHLAILQKTFHVSIVKPFSSNMRKELTKMPKLYFSDLGLRNFFSGGFGAFDTRSDRGVLFENAAFRMLCERFEEESIRFWRTINNHEIDFVVNGTRAFEAKTRAKNVNISIARFKEMYPSIPVSLVSLEKKEVAEQKGIQTVFPWEI